MRVIPTPGRDERVAKGNRAARYEFIITELEIAVTYCHLSLDSRDAEKVTRNADNARQAYRAAARFFDESQLSPEMNREVHLRIDQLVPLLARLPR
jgi:hypothetical protein